MKLECRRATLVALAFAFVGLSGEGGATEKLTVAKEAATAREIAEPAASGFVRAKGRGLVLDGKPFRLRAVNFSNRYHTKLSGTELLSARHHSERDFAKVKELGFNAIRFAINGEWHARFPDVFWQWLDQNVGWARAHGIYLILDLHTPAGSFWLDPTSPDVNFDIWTKPDVRARTIGFWREVASRYRAESHVAGYDILNEPVTTDATGRQWRDLAQEIIAAIRAVDPDHLLIVGGLYGINGQYGTGEAEAHFVVDDDNVMYDFHFYEPIKYSHQYATWLTGPIKDGGRYPDPQVVLPTGDQVLLPESRINSRSVGEGTTGWTLYDSGAVAIRDKTALAARPMIAVRGGVEGTVFFDAFKVIEYDRKGAFVREVTEEPLTSDGALDWYPWQSESGRQPAILEREQKSGQNDAASLSIRAGGGSSSVSGWSSDGHLFKVVPGNRYRIVGYMRGEDVKLASGASAGFEIDVYRGAPGAPGKGFFERGKPYLEYEMMKHLAFGIRHKVPMSVMEFGLVRQAFEMPGKGGREWVADMMSLMEEHNLSFAYWEYHGEPMGLYFKGATGPGQPNADLLDILRQELTAGCGAADTADCPKADRAGSAR